MTHRRVLLIAYHYPPVQVSSGIQRTLKFSRYLPDFGWQPSVLSINPRAYETTSASQVEEIPREIEVLRAFGLDTARHLRILGYYPALLALPDRWMTWWIGGVFQGLRHIRRFRPDVIWSTYPIATAHLIGLTLSRLTGIPWVADFRDSMTEPGYPSDPMKRRAYTWIERKAVETCARAVFTTPGAVRMYQTRYPRLEGNRWAVIPNGFDEENFAAAEAKARRGAATVRPLTMVHSGILYPSERDPTAFFAALGGLKKGRGVTGEELRVVLRATGHDDFHEGLIKEYGIEDIVQLAPSIPYEDALVEMMEASCLLLFQAANCNHQIPAKLYEYIRAMRPILAMTDEDGDTAAVLRPVECATVVGLEDRNAIAGAIEAFLERGDQGRTTCAQAPAEIARFSRYERTRELAEVLDGVAGAPA